MIILFFSIPQRIRIFFSIIYLALIAFLSLIPSNSIPKISLFIGMDKIVHFCMYLGLAWIFSWTIQGRLESFRYFLIGVLAIMWGVMMEIFQYLMHAGRSFEFFDIICNSTGVLCGLFVYFLMARKIYL